MFRYLITAKAPVRPQSIPADALVIVPNPGVGRVLGVPVRTLQEHAKWLLAKNDFVIATPIKAAAALRKAVQEIMPGSDASAIAAHYRDMIGAVLRSGADLEKLASVGVRHAGNLGRVARD